MKFRYPRPFGDIVFDESTPSVQTPIRVLLDPSTDTLGVNVDRSSGPMLEKVVDWVRQKPLILRLSIPFYQRR